MEARLPVRNVFGNLFCHNCCHDPERECSWRTYKYPGRDGRVLCSQGFEDQGSAVTGDGHYCVAGCKLLLLWIRETNVLSQKRRKKINAILCNSVLRSCCSSSSVPKRR